MRGCEYVKVLYLCQTKKKAIDRNDRCCSFFIFSIGNQTGALDTILKLTLKRIKSEQILTLGIKLLSINSREY